MEEEECKGVEFYKWLMLLVWIDYYNYKMFPVIPIVTKEKIPIEDAQKKVRKQSKHATTKQTCKTYQWQLQESNNHLQKFVQNG